MLSDGVSTRKGYILTRVAVVTNMLAYYALMVQTTGVKSFIEPAPDGCNNSDQRICLQKTTAIQK